MVPELGTRTWYLNLVPPHLKKKKLTKELTFKELTFKELDVFGYFDPLGLGVFGYFDLLGLGVFGYFDLLGMGVLGYSDLLGMGRLFRSIGIGPAIPIYWDWAFPRRLFEGDYSKVCTWYLNYGT